MPGREARQTLRCVPPKQGLVNAGTQTLMPEDSFWRLDNMDISFDGKMVKRPGLIMWGQQLKESATGGLRYSETFNDLSDFAQTTVGTAGDTSLALSNSRVQIATLAVSGALSSKRAVRLAQPNDGTSDNALQMSWRFAFRATSTLPANPANVNAQGPTFLFRSEGTGGGGTNTYGLVVYADGLALKHSGTLQYTLVSSLGGTSTAEVGDGNWHIVEIQVVGTSLTSLVVDGTQRLGTFVMTVDASYGITASQFGILVPTNTVSLYSAEFDFVQGRSGITVTNVSGVVTFAPFVGVPITALFDWRSKDTTEIVTKQLMIVAGSTIYADTNHGGVFLAIDTTPAAPLTTFANFQRLLVICNPQAAVRTWDGVAAPVTVASAPHGSFSAEHLNRLFLAGVDGQPLRVFFSGVGNLNDWTTPLGGAFIDSGFFDIPDRLGERVTALAGDFYGSLIIWTNSSCWRLSGNSTATFALTCISSTVGCAGPRAYVRVGNSLMFISSLGVHDLQTTQEFGDIKSNFVSAKLLSRWLSESFTDLATVQQGAMYRATAAYSPQRGNVLFGLPLAADADIAHGLVLNVPNGQWAGPWDAALVGLDHVRLSYPERPVFMAGSADGRVGYFGSDAKADFGSTAYTAYVESQRIDLRSLGEDARQLDKKPRELRLYVQPRGDWDLTVNWFTDENYSRTPITISQNPRGADTLTDDFRLGHSKLTSAEAVAILPVELDGRARWFRYTVQQAAANQDMVLIGTEVDFIAQATPKENK